MVVCWWLGVLLSVVVVVVMMLVLAAAAAVAAMFGPVLEVVWVAAPAVVSLSTAEALLSRLFRLACFCNTL